MQRNRKYSFLFVSAPFSGVEVMMKNLKEVVSRNEEIDSHWIWLDYDTRLPGLGDLVSKRVNWTLKACINIHFQILELERAGKIFDAAFFNHVSSMTLLRNFRRRVPTVLSLDATPRMLDQFSHWFLWDQTARISGIFQKYKDGLTRRAYLETRRLLAWSDAVNRSLVQDYGIPREKIATVPPGVDLESWNPVPDDQRERSHKLNVLFVGGEFLRKGGDIILRVAQRNEFRNCEFHFVTKSFVGERLPNVHVHSGLSPNTEDLRNIYRMSDIALLPTRADFSPHAILEAMARGMPVISTDVGAIREMVVHGKTGYLVPGDQEEAIAYRLRALVENSGLRWELGNNARKLVESKFNLEKNAHEIIECLKNVSKPR